MWNQIKNGVRINSDLGIALFKDLGNDYEVIEGEDVFTHTLDENTKYILIIPWKELDKYKDIINEKDNIFYKDAPSYKVKEWVDWFNKWKTKDSICPCELIGYKVR